MNIWVPTLVFPSFLESRMRFSQIFFCSIRTGQLSSGVHKSGVTIPGWQRGIHLKFVKGGAKSRCSALWSGIIHYTEDSLPWIDELLQRSRQTTLELGQAREFGELVSPRLFVLSCVMLHAQRLKTVNMSVEQAAWQGICEGILQNRAPSLEYIRIHLIVPFMKMFTGTLFSDDAPCLRWLHLRRCLVDLSSPTLSNLTELSVASITFGAPTIDAWLNILGNMTFLCWFSIERAISRPFLTCPLPNPHLPNLSCLAMDGDFRDCMALINHITYNPLHVLRLKFVDVTPGPILKDLSSMIEKRLSLWSPPAKAEHHFDFKCLYRTEMLIGNSKQLGGTWSGSKSEAADDTSLQYPVMSIRLVFVNSEEMESSIPPFLLSFDHLLMGVFSLIFWLDSSTQHMFGFFLEVLHILNNVEEINFRSLLFYISCKPRVQLEKMCHQWIIYPHYEGFFYRESILITVVGWLSIPWFPLSNTSSES